MLAVVVAGSVIAQQDAVPVVVAPEVITPASLHEDIVENTTKGYKDLSAKVVEAPSVKVVEVSSVAVETTVKKEESCVQSAACKHDHQEVCKDAACKQGFLCAAVGAIVAVPAFALTQIKAHPYIAGAVVLATAVAAVVVYNSKKASDKKRAKRN